MSQVSFSHVAKTYDGKTFVVRDLNLEIARGEFLTMLGPSGSGKTTSLMMLAGFESVTHGDIRLDGRPITNVPPQRRGIGMVFQNYALFPHMTAAENLAFPLQVRRLPRAERDARVRRALDMVALTGFADRRPAQLSGGQQQRVAVARALVFDPSLLLMDEPLGALDKQLRHQLQYEITQIHRRLGVTIVYVTHDQSEALTMSDRIAIFNEGEIQQVSAPTELYEQPQTSFVAQFIGENNTLSGVVEDLADGQCRVRLDSGDLVGALAVGVTGRGSASTLSLRPECVMLDPAMAESDTILDALVQDQIYHGDHVRLRLAVAGNDNFIVKIPNTRRPDGLARGQRIRVGWRTDDCRALDPLRTTAAAQAE